MTPSELAYAVNRAWQKLPKEQQNKIKVKFLNAYTVMRLHADMLCVPTRRCVEGKRGLQEMYHEVQSVLASPPVVEE